MTMKPSYKYPLCTIVRMGDFQGVIVSREASTLTPSYRVVIDYKRRLSYGLTEHRSTDGFPHPDRLIFQDEIEPMGTCYTTEYPHGLQLTIPFALFEHLVIVKDALTGEERGRYARPCDAAKEHGLDKSNVTACMKGRIGSTKGLVIGYPDRFEGGVITEVKAGRKAG